MECYSGAFFAMVEYENFEGNEIAIIVGSECNANTETKMLCRLFAKF